MFEDSACPGSKQLAQSTGVIDHLIEGLLTKAGRRDLMGKAMVGGSILSEQERENPGRDTLTCELDLQRMGWLPSRTTFSRTVRPLPNN